MQLAMPLGGHHFMFRRAITSTIHLLAISMGVFRLRHRYRTKQYYWDDLWAACTLFADVGLFLSIWLWPIYSVPGNHIEPEEPLSRIWIVGVLLPTINWTSRIGVAFSIFRIAEKDVPRRRCILALISMFLVLWILAITLKCIHCSEMRTLQLNRVDPSCMGHIAQLCFTGLFIICDSCLVSIPLHMLRHLRLPRTDRFVVRAVFSASVLSATADIVTTTCNLVYFPDKITHIYVVGMTVQIRGAVSLIVCNLIVVGPCIYRLFRRAEQDLSIPISFHIEVTPVRMSIDDCLVPPLSQVERALVREQRSRRFALAHLAAMISGGLLHASGEHLSESQPSLDASTAHKYVKT
ncbi:hypothetical protein F5887DRAFT_1011112 [Amanita rubescens]|nr:hypothetical protein F5887DRAFT_1011112 [Amanita rubescens]